MTSGPRRFSLNLQSVSGLVPSPPAPAGLSGTLFSATATARARRGQEIINRARRRQSARAVQVQMGVGEIPRRLRQSLDAAGNQHEPRHRPVEEAKGLTEDERRVVKRNLGFFVTADSLAQRTISFSAPIAISPAECRNTFCGRRFEEAIHTHGLPVHRRELASGRGEVFNALPRIPSIRTKTSSSSLHRHPDRPDLPDRHARGRPKAAAQPHRVAIVRKSVLLRGLHPDSGAGSSE